MNAHKVAIITGGGEPERIERLKSVISLQQGGQPEEVAEAIFWLAIQKLGNFLSLRAVPAVD